MSSINETAESFEQSSKEEISDSDESATDTDASEEIVDDSAETLSDSSEEVQKLPKKSHKPSPNRILSSDEEEEEDEDDDDDEEDIKVPKKSHKPHIVSSDEEEEEDDEEDDDEDNIKVPKKSHKPHIVSSDEEEEDDDDEEDIKLPKTSRRHHANRIVSSDEEEEEEDDEEDERAISPRTRMSITGIRPADMSDDSSSDDIDNDEVEEQSEKVEIKRSSLTARRSSNSRSPNNLETDESVQESTLIEEKKNSPFPMRYTKIFANNINDKLSSTILAPQDDVKEEEETINIRESSSNSSDTDVKIIDVKNATIEIFSSDDEDTPPKIIEAKKEPQSEQLLQPKINFAMPKPVVSSKQQNQDSFKYVSAEFYSKEVRKLAEIKSDLKNSECVLKQCGKSLPDQGQQLQKRIDSLQRDLEIKAKYISTLKIENETQPRKNIEQAKLPDWSELSAAVNAIQPKYTGKQGLATFNTQRSMTIETLKGLHSSLEGCPAENVLADEPTGLKVSLMPHQRHALAWMAWREQQKPHGGILADDMGLGKTLTTIAMVLAAKQRKQAAGENKENESSEEDEPKQKAGWISKGKQKSYKGGTLVVCPASLIRQWEDEVNNKLKRNLLSVGLHHGPNRETRAKNLINYDFVVTTYQLVSREHKAQSVLFDIVWERIILDEAHIVRNHKAASSVAVYELRGKNRWALTGTPIQNKELDMYALLRFLRCKPFDDFATWKLWIETHTGGKERLHTILKTLMLRRTKALLQDAGGLQCLPEKRTELISVNLEPEEMAVYQKVLVISRSLFAQYLMQHAERQTEMGYRGKDPNEHYYKLHQKFAKYHKVKEVKSAEILLLLLRLRQICCHPSLIHAMLEENDTELLESDEERGDESVFNLLEQVNKLTIDDKSINNKLDDSAEQEQIAKASAKIMYRSNPVFDQERPSTKMSEVIKTLKTHVLPKNEKAIVVSQWTSYLDILKRHIESHGIKTLSLNGQIPVKFRQDIVNEFNKPNDKQILLLSLTAGGVGLNLVGANHLLLMDLHWNPQLEAQAQDRIYRVGQKKNITVYKFMCLNTVEERIKALQDRKLEIACSVLTGVKSTSGSKLTIDDLKGLFDM